MAISREHLRTIRKVFFQRAGLKSKEIDPDFDFESGALINEVGKKSKVSVLGRILENSAVGAKLKAQLESDVIEDLFKNGEAGVPRFARQISKDTWQVAEVSILQQNILERIVNPDVNPLTAKEKNWLFERFDERFPKGQWFSSMERYVTGYEKILKQYEADRNQYQANWLSEMLGDVPPVSEEKRKSYILK